MPPGRVQHQNGVMLCRGFFFLKLQKGVAFLSQELFKSEMLKVKATPHNCEVIENMI
jgi:hypothetical protein